MYESFPGPVEQSSQSPENLAVDEAMRGEAKVFAAEMEYGGIEPTVYRGEQTDLESRYWIIRRGTHYDGTRLAVVRQASRSVVTLRQVIIVHEDGRLDIATQRSVFQAEPHRQYVPHNIENIHEALHLDRFDAPEQVAAVLAEFRNDLDHLRPSSQ